MTQIYKKHTQISNTKFSKISPFGKAMVPVPLLLSRERKRKFFSVNSFGASGNKHCRLSLCLSINTCLFLVGLCDPLGSRGLNEFVLRQPKSGHLAQMVLEKSETCHFLPQRFKSPQDGI